MSLMVVAKGITKLSQLQIDTDKDWGGKGITNIRQIADGMAKGHVIQHNGLVLESLPPGSANNVLTSAGPGQKVVWAPGGTYLNRYFPVSIDLSKDTETPFIPDRSRAFMAPLTVPYGVEDNINPGWVERFKPEIDLSFLAGLLDSDHAQGKTPEADVLIRADMPVNGGLSDDGGVLADETAQAKSGLTKDQSYEAGDDNQQSMGSSAAWEAQTFTTGLAQRVRGVWLKLYKSGASAQPGTVTVSIRAVDGSGHPTGVDLCIGTIDGNAIQFLDSAGAGWVWVPFTTGALLSNATKYALVVRCASGSLYWRCDTTSPTYGSGNREYSTNSGTSWTADNAKDFMFQVFYTLDDTHLLPAGLLQINDAWYWGYDQRFDRIYQDVGAAGAGTYTLAFEYSLGAGAWAACIGLVDGTNGFRNLWLNTISHAKQGDWAKDTLSGRNLYWIRARVTDAGAGYSQPLGTYAQVSLDL